MSWFIVFLFIFIILTFLKDSLHFGITPTPTSKKVRNKILEILPEKIDGSIFELGSGFGTMTFDLAQKFNSNKVLGYEGAKIPYFISQLLSMWKRPLNAELLYRDFKHEDLSKAGLVFCYLYRDIMPILVKKFNTELPKGTWVISHTFAIYDWKPLKVYYADDIYKTPIYVYQT